MNKSFKRFGKAKWVNTTLSRHYKARVAISSVVLSGLSAAANATIQVIIQSNRTKFEKGLAIATRIVSYEIERMNKLSMIHGMKTSA